MCVCCFAIYLTVVCSVVNKHNKEIHTKPYFGVYFVIFFSSVIGQKEGKKVFLLDLFLCVFYFFFLYCVIGVQMQFSLVALK